MRINKLRERIKELRTEKGKTQRNVADCLGITVSAYANYEQGRTEPDFNMLIKLAQYFEVKTDYLLGLTDD